MRSLCIAVFFLSAIQEPNIVGSWYAETRTENAVGILFEFAADGKFNYSLGAIREYKYRFESEKLILTIDPQRVETFTVRIAGGRLSMGRSQEMAEYSRLGQPEAGENSIVGFWTRMEERNGTRHAVHWRFRNDGSAVFTFPFGWTPGVYTTNGNKIRLVLDGRPPVDGPWRWEGPALILPAAKGPAKYYRR